MSANGRHRRPRQAPALIVAAGVTGSAIAIPLLGAAGASAADATTWDHVAECESGGAWSADLGNGYFGGLQMSQETWKSFGGDQYASRPDLASRAQQIRVAEKVLDAQGPQAWTSCAAVSGLTKSDAVPDVDPGAGSDPAAEDEAPTGVSNDNGGGTVGSVVGGLIDGVTGGGDNGSAPPKATYTPAPSPSATTPSGAPSATTPAPDASETPSGTPSGTPSKASKHRGAAAPETELPGNSDEQRETGRHASRVDEPVHDAKGDGISVGQYATPVAEAPTLITDALKLPGGWQQIYAADAALASADLAK